MKKNISHKLAFHFPYIADTCPSWKEVLHLATPLSVKKGNSLLDTKEDAYSFYYIEEGLFQIKYYSSQGKTRGITCFGENSLICFASAYLQLDNESSEIYCLHDAKIWKFDSKLLNDDNFKAKYPLLMDEIVKQLSINLLINMTYTTNMLLEPAYERVIFFLLAYDEEKIKNTKLPTFTQQEMAEMLNLHRVTFVKILQKLKDEGLIDLHKKQNISIIDKARLKAKVMMNE